MFKTFSALRVILRPWYFKALAGIPIVLGLYDVGCNQFGWPKIPRLLGMTGSFLPWWGWLLLLQLIFVFALIEYALGISSLDASLFKIPDDEIVSLLERRIGPLPLNEGTIGEAFTNSDARASAYMVSLSERIDKLVSKTETMGKLSFKESEQKSEMDNILHEKIIDLNRRFSESVLNFGVRITVLEDYKILFEKTNSQTKAGFDAALALLGQHQTSAENEFKELREGLELVRHDVRLADDARESQNAKMRESVYAIYNREILNNLSANIEREASELYDALYAGEKYDAERWKAWEETHSRWESALKAWDQNGRWYSHEVVARIWTVDDVKYEADWTVEDDQFPNFIAAHKFKKFRIIQTQWREVRDSVDRGVIQVAFVGLTAAEMQRNRPR